MVIDTETHVFYRLLPIETNPELSWAKRFTWHEFPGDLLVAEMDRAGVDIAVLISYDAESVGYWLYQNGKLPEDFIGGKKYTLRFVDKYPTRFAWFTTVSFPHVHSEYLDWLEEDLERGAVGIKVFAAHLEMRADDDRLMAAYELCASRGAKVILAFEDTNPPKTPTVSDYLTQLPGILDAFPTTNFQVMHGGNIAPDAPEAPFFFETVRNHSNVWVSTGPVEALAPGDRDTQWRDGWEYPFRHYLETMRKLAEGVGIDRVEWATDWPWMEHLIPYPLAVDCIRKHADFWSADEKAKVLGANAARFLDLSADASEESPAWTTA